MNHCTVCPHAQIAKILDFKFRAFFQKLRCFQDGRNPYLMFLQPKICLPDPLLLPVLPSFSYFSSNQHSENSHIGFCIFFWQSAPGFGHFPKWSQVGLSLLKPKILGHSARKRYRIIFLTFYYANLKKVVKKGANQAKVRGS